MKHTEVKNKRVDVCLINVCSKGLSLKDICDLNNIPFWKSLNFNLTLQPYDIEKNPDCSLAYLDIQYVEKDSSIDIDTFPNIEQEEDRINKLYNSLREIVLRNV